MTVPDDQPRFRMTIHVTAQEYQQVHARAEENHTTASAYVRELIDRDQPKEATDG
jgi:hypothetical protein